MLTVSAHKLEFPSAARRLALSASSGFFVFATLGCTGNGAATTNVALSPSALDGGTLLLNERTANISSVTYQTEDCSTELANCLRVSDFAYLAFYKKCKDVQNRTKISEEFGRIRMFSVMPHGNILDGSYIIEGQPNVQIIYQSGVGITELRIHPESIFENFNNNEFFRQMNYRRLKVNYSKEMSDFFLCV